jgi:hypothetical protein
MIQYRAVARTLSNDSRVFVSGLTPRSVLRGSLPYRSGSDRAHETGIAGEQKLLLLQRVPFSGSKEGT